MSSEAKVIIEAGKTHSRYLLDLWHYRELFFMLAWRDVLVRYKQTVIGVAWSVIRPLLGMIVFTVVFGKIAKLPSGDVPYLLLVFAGMMIWQFFSNTVSTGSESLLGNSSLISKVYFPRLIIPSTSMTVSLVDFLISAVVFIPLLAYFRWIPTWRILCLPLFVILAAVISLGVVYTVASMNVKYRDFRYVIPFAIQLGMYISPVGFASAVVPEKWRLLYSLNPLVGVIDGLRWCMFGTPVYIPALIVSVVFGTMLLSGGYFLFRRMEREFADFI